MALIKTKKDGIYIYRNEQDYRADRPIIWRNNDDCVPWKIRIIVKLVEVITASFTYITFLIESIKRKIKL